MGRLLACGKWVTNQVIRWVVSGCPGAAHSPAPHTKDGSHTIQFALLFARAHKEGDIIEHVVEIVVAVVEGTGEVLGQLVMALKQVSHRVKQW